jgi:hypothetical protein
MTAPPRQDRLTSAELAGEVARTRARLSRGLAVLDREYAVRHLVVRASRLARKPEIDAGHMRDLLRHDAAPLAFIGIGVGWLILAGRGAGRDLLQQVGAAIAALQNLAREFGLTPSGGEPPSPPAPLPPPETGG